MKDSSVILIHGMWSTSNTLSTFRERLEARGYRVYSPNLPWHGDEIRNSTNRVANLSILDYTTHLRDYITNLKLEEPPILIGHSMGGLLAQKLGAGTKARALVLLCPAQSWGINIITPSANIKLINAIQFVNQELSCTPSLGKWITCLTYQVWRKYCPTILNCISAINMYRSYQ